VFASSKGNEVSVELNDIKNGAFTRALISGIKDGRANLLGTGRITPSQLDAFVTEEVKKTDRRKAASNHVETGHDPGLSVCHCAIVVRSSRSYDKTKPGRIR
jgi:hypothetical protein